MQPSSQQNRSIAQWFSTIKTRDDDFLHHRPAALARMFLAHPVFTTR